MSSELDVKHINGGRALPKGSKPPAIVHTFLSEDGTDEPYDMTVGVWLGQAKAQQLHVDTQPAGLGAGTVTVHAPSASATYNWTAVDFSIIGRFRLIIWAGNGTERLGSTVYEWDVADAPGADPTV